MTKQYNFEGISLNQQDRSAIVRYHSVEGGTADIKVIFHEGGEMDFENFEFLTEEEFNDLTMFLYEDEAVNEAFPCEH